MLSKTQIEQAVRIMLSRNVTMVTAPTASGKSSRLPVELFRQLKASAPAGTRVKLVVSVPTRLAAEALTEIVQTTNQGIVVDSRYHGKSYREDAQIVYSTPAFLLGEYMRALEKGGDPRNFPWSFVVVDEVHTGNLENSLIFSFHDLLAQRYEDLRLRTLRLGLLTATPVEVFIFPDAYRERLVLTVQTTNPTYVPYRPPPFFLEKTLAPRNLAEAMANIVKNIHVQNRDKYTILLFVESMHSCEVLYEKIVNKRLEKVEVIKVYGAMRKQERDRAREQPPAGKRRIIVATNVAESSITIPRVGYVVDSMLEKRPIHGIMGSKSALILSYISENSALQRKSRAGRDVPNQVYFPMVTEEEWKTKIQSQPFRTPDIMLISLEKVTLSLLLRGFDPRGILDEAGQDTISRTETNLLQSEMLLMQGFRQRPGPILDTEKSKNPLYEQLLNGYIPTEAGLLREALDFAVSANLQEMVSVTSLGRTWVTFPTGLTPTMFITTWLEKGYPSPLMGALVASIMDTNVGRLFPLPVTESGKKVDHLFKYHHYQEKLPLYIAEDPLTTILCVFYALFLAQPEILALRFNEQKIGLWCRTQGLTTRVVLDVLRGWRVLVSKLNEEHYYDFKVYIEIAEVIKYTIETLRESTFFHLSKGPYKEYYRSDSKTPCLIDVSSIPYDMHNVPTDLLFLTISERKSARGRKEKDLEIVSLFVPKHFVFRRHFKKQFLLKDKLPAQLPQVQFLEESTTSLAVRLPVVSPLDIGLSEHLYVPRVLDLPQAQWKGEQPPPQKEFTRNRYASALYPPIFPAQVYTTKLRAESVAAPPDEEYTTGINFLEFDFGEGKAAVVEYEDLSPAGLAINEEEEDDYDYNEYIYDPLYADISTY